MDRLSSDGSTDMKDFTLICHTAAIAQPEKHQSPAIDLWSLAGLRPPPPPTQSHVHPCARLRPIRLRWKQVSTRVSTVVRRSP